RNAINLVPLLLPSFSLSFHASPPHRHLPSFPTRRSSDLTTVPPFLIRANSIIRKSSRSAANTWNCVTDSCLISTAPYGSVEIRRSEEHTSELQSRSDLVCRLLLEKKKKNII